jgi:phosphotransferase system enzyme I (PtsI)
LANLTDSITQLRKTIFRPKVNQKILHGVVISPGFAVGRAYIYKDILFRNYDLYTIKPADFREEYRRIELAISDVSKDLQTTAERIEKEFNSQIATIFLSQIEMLKDPELLSELKNELRSNLVNAEQIVKTVLRKWELRFRQIQDETICLRADDIVDLSRRILKALTGIYAHTLECLPPGSIIVAKQLLPSDTVFLSRKSTCGIVTEYGGMASHTALLTREIGIPSLGKIPAITELVQNGDLLLVDGSSGSLVINPGFQIRREFSKKVQIHSVANEEIRKDRWVAAQRKNGAIIEVMANASYRSDVEAAMKNGADGIGLLRIENLYLSRKHPPSVDELTNELMNILEPVHNKPVTIRLLDVGGDKKLSYLSAASLDDTFLGRRGIRFLLEYPELLYTQINAIIKVAQRFNVRILAPMVTFADEMKLVDDMVKDLVFATGYREKIPLGVMIETPASAICSKDFLPYVDFFSIGTNDLTQYTMAAGRENHTAMPYFRDDHPAIFHLIKMVTSNAGEKAVSLCGELGSHSSAVKLLLDIGVGSLSVAPTFIAEIKQAVRES